MDVDHDQISRLDASLCGQAVGDVRPGTGANVGPPEFIRSRLAHGVLRFRRNLALREDGFQGLDGGRHAGNSNRRRGPDSFNLSVLLGNPQCGQDRCAIFRDHLFRLAVRMGQHAHHGVGQKGIFQPNASLLNTEMFEMVGDGMDHPHLVFEAGDVVEKGQSLHVLHIGRGDAQGHFSFTRDHRIGAQTAVACQIGHVRRFHEEQDVESSRLHQPGAACDAF